MGMELYCECDQCGYTFGASVGFGLAYPWVYSQTIKKLKEGQYGKQGKEFLEAFPDGAITCHKIVVQCNDCKQLMCVPELLLYVPKDGFNPKKYVRKTPWSVSFSGEGYDYVTFDELDDYYELFEEYDHRCSHCNGHTTVVPGFTDSMNPGIERKVCCPNCGSLLDIEIFEMWD